MNIFKKLVYAGLLVMVSFSCNAQSNSSKQVTITSFTAGTKANKLVINWSTDGAVPTNYFEVQCSEDGSIFKTIGLVLGPDPKQSGDSYMYAAAEKKNSGKPVYFRLRHVDTNGDTQLSKMIQL